MNLILLQPDELLGNRVTLRDQRAKHIRTVLGAELGKTLRVGLLNGALGTGTVCELNDESVELSCEWDDLPPRPPVSLILAMPRPKVLKRLWAQFSALGVRRIILVNAQKVERYYFDSHIIEPSFYEPLLIEGLQQARDTWLPEVRIERFLKPFVEDQLPQLTHNAQCWIADPSGARTVAANPAQETFLAIGPEGGWTPFELDLFRSAGFDCLGLGSRILRTDTACIALLSRFL